MKTFVLAFLGCLAIFLAHYLVVGNGVWGDGRYYYAIVRSAIVDGNLDFHNESQVNPFAFEYLVTPTGRIFNKYSIGTPLLWLPFFSLMHGTILGLRFFDFTLWPADGYGHPYRLAVGVASVLYGWLGIYFTFLGLKKWLNKQLALLSCLLIALGTNVFFYLAVDPVNSHAASIFAAGLFFWSLTRWQAQPTWKLSLAIGASCGMLALIRSQDSLFLLGFAWLLMQQPKLSFKIKCKHFVSAFLVAVMLFLPQLAEWYYLLGRIQNPYFYIGEEFLPFHPHLLEVLFSFNNGLLVWSPLFIVSAVGLWISRRHVLSQVGLILWAVETYTIASWRGWWGGESFGGRMFLTLTPFLIWGVAQVLRRFAFSYSWQVQVSLLSTVAILNSGAILFFLLNK